MNVQAKRHRTLSTLISDIVIYRRLYVKATKRVVGKGRFLIDEALNIQPRRCDPRTIETDGISFYADEFSRGI
jgi:hypothetical protein